MRNKTRYNFYLSDYQRWEKSETHKLMSENIKVETFSGKAI